MPEKLTFKLITHDKQNSDFDWLNIDCGPVRVGKVRGLINGRALTICSINIFPEFEGRGYAKKTIEMFKESFDTIVADRVRYTAVGFWVKMGFTRREDGNYVYHKRRETENGNNENMDYGCVEQYNAITQHGDKRLCGNII
jgi:ribosomal protein S18 acetylase RimI-like enzyme